MFYRTRKRFKMFEYQRFLRTSSSPILLAQRNGMFFFFAFLFMTQLAKKFRKPFPAGHDVEKLPAPQENQLVPEIRRVLFVSPFFLYRYSWLSRDVIAAIVDDMKEGFLTKFICLCHAGSPPGHSHLTLSVLDGNRQSSRTLPFLICIIQKRHYL